MVPPKPRVKAPSDARTGEVIEIKTLFRHPMETGLRVNDDGTVVSRRIINRFVCRYDDVVVFSVDLQPGVAANPYFRFHTVARRSGTLRFFWHEDGGKVYTAERKIRVG